jgi:hypothetical protein
LAAQPSPIFEPDPKIDAELAALGLPSQMIQANALLFSEAERRSCTENDPGILKGMIGSGRGIRSLREQLRPLKWHREEPNSLPLVTSPDRKIALTIATGDENAGRKGTPFARTKWRKGPMLTEWVSPSRQMSMLDVDETGEPEPRPELWILLVQRTKTEILAELSHPTSVSKDNKLRFGNTKKRFFMPPIPIDQTQQYDDEDDEDYDASPDVPVERL